MIIDEKLRFQEVLNKMQFVYATIQDENVVVQYPFYVDPNMVYVVRRTVEAEAERLANQSKRQTYIEVNIYVRPLLELNIADIRALCGNKLPGSIETIKDLAELHATPVAPVEVYRSFTSATGAIFLGMLHHFKQFRLGKGCDRERLHEKLVRDMPHIFMRAFHPKPSDIKGE